MSEELEQLAQAVAEASPEALLYALARRGAKTRPLAGDKVSVHLHLSLKKNQSRKRPRQRARIVDDGQTFGLRLPKP